MSERILSERALEVALTNVRLLNQFSLQHIKHINAFWFFNVDKDCYVNNNVVITTPEIIVNTVGAPPEYIINLIQAKLDEWKPDES